MRALLDVNVLIALLDSDHVSHAAALHWLADHGGNGWASCPITQNGCIRIMSHHAYPNPQPVQAIVQRLHAATQHEAHQFWADDLSLLDARHLTPARIHGSRQLTDAYLLALAVQHEGCLVTFDRAVVRSAVPGATPAHLVVL